MSKESNIYKFQITETPTDNDSVEVSFEVLEGNLSARRLVEVLGPIIARFIDVLEGNEPDDENYE